MKRGILATSVVVVLAAKETSYPSGSGTPPISARYLIHGLYPPTGTRPPRPHPEPTTASTKCSKPKSNGRESPDRAHPQPQPPGTLHPKAITKVANMPKQARFYIDVPTGQVDLLEQTLLSIGIQFCPFDNMVHLPRENLLDSIFTGKEGQYAIDKVNEKLEELDRPERINLEFHQMTTETRWDLLAFVTMEIDWESEYQPEIQSLDPGRVTQFLSEHPETAVPQELK